MGNGAMIGALGLGAFHVNVDPLVVERGVGKQIDTVLVDGEPIARTEFLAQMRGKFFVRVDGKHSISLIVNS